MYWHIDNLNFGSTSLPTFCTTQHHEFPTDYRNGPSLYDYDPTKWIIYALSRTGLTHSLITTPSSCILQAKHAVLTSLLPPPKNHPLQTLTLHDVQNAVTNEGKEWIVIEGYVLDVKEFKDRHPGGRDWLRKWFGMDASRMFNGGACLHTQAARRLMEEFRVGVVSG